MVPRAGPQRAECAAEAVSGDTVDIRETVDTGNDPHIRVGSFGSHAMASIPHSSHKWKEQERFLRFKTRPMVDCGAQSRAFVSPGIYGLAGYRGWS